MKESRNYMRGGILMFDEYLAKLSVPEHVNRYKEIMDWISTNYSYLEGKVAWNQPMYTHEGTFIISFGASKKHMSVAPERKAIDHFEESIKEAGYERTKELIKIPWKMNVNYELLAQIIDFNIEDKKGYKSFWRK